MANLGLTSTEVDKFFDTNKYILNIPRHRIIKNCLMCQKYDIKMDSIEKLHYCLKLQNYTLEHRINVLKELGVPVINISLLNHIHYHFHTELSKFKNKVNIPAEQNIAANIFGDEVSEYISKLHDTLTVQEYYQTCLLYCKNRVFNLSYLDDKILLHSYIKIKSIRMIAETLEILRLDLHYDEKMIKNNPSVIIASADNIRLLLNSSTNALGMPIVTFLRKYPSILFQDAVNVIRLLKLFKKYEIPDKYVKKCMNVFLISYEDFQERLEMIKQHPDLNLWYKHPRILQLVYRIKQTKQRIEYINIMDSWKWAQPQTFLSSNSAVDKSLQTGLVSSKKNLKHIFIQELGVDKSKLLMRHQHWKMAAFNDIMQMLKYLKKHFTINEICSNIHIVLYKQSRVKKVLADLKQQYSQNIEYSFTNSQYLALCLYILEKNNHFTGDGVWINEQNTKEQSLKKRNIIEKFDNNIGTLEDMNNNFSIEDNSDIDHNDIDIRL
ncbi:PREDICTED: uncharacterized protein LOC105620913 [Atta cephalotes]|uniref:Transcription termination factor 5, mitochondrial n=1 Tax=Atta cephalotes TaxID=12957 RepID=A0A158NJS3_ATTCE|nr:PREDICTED: uncharacterized protein LOC105620913 [Atta cephalotes]